MKIGIAGANGLVGQKLLSELLDKHYNESVFSLFCSDNNSIKALEVNSRKWEIRPISHLLETSLDVCFFATPVNVSKEWIPKISNKCAFIIDGSSAFRNNLNVPLIIPEINPGDLKKTDKCVSSPNCTTTLALMALAPLCRYWNLESFSLCSYQAASGMGYKGLNELLQQSKAYLNGEKLLPSKVFPRNLAFNVIPQVGEFITADLTDEEEKICLESRKILHQPTLNVFATCVRVPVLRCHSICLSATFKENILLSEVQYILSDASGIKYYPEGYPDTTDAFGNELCHVGRLRMDSTRSRTLNMWLVGDQLLKGAATNMRQIFELKLNL